MDFLFYHLKMKMVEKLTKNIIFQLWKYYDNLIDGRSFFDKTIKNDSTMYNKISKSATGKSYDYTTGCFLDYPLFQIIL